MRRGQNILAFVLTLTWFAASFAANNSACIPVSTKKIGNDLVLLTNPPPKTSWIYFFNNISQTSLFIDHPSSGKGVSAGWSSYLRAGHWSALALNKSNFTIHCSAIKPGNVIALDCSKVISVCIPKNLSFKTPLKGNYWLTEDKPWESFVKGLQNRGVSF